MTNSATKAHRVELVCGHVRFYKYTPTPGDDVFCTSCNAASQTGPTDAKEMGALVVDPEQEFWTRRTNKRAYDAGCLYDGCIVETTGSEYYALAQKLHSHYINMHTSLGSGIEIIDGIAPKRKRPNPNEPPPF